MAPLAHRAPRLNEWYHKWTPLIAFFAVVAMAAFFTWQNQERIQDNKERTMEIARSNRVNSKEVCEFSQRARLNTREQDQKALDRQVRALTIQLPTPQELGVPGVDPAVYQYVTELINLGRQSAKDQVAYYEGRLETIRPVRCVLRGDRYVQVEIPVGTDGT